VYYVSEVLHEAKTTYLEVNKLLYAVLIASSKLRHYFHAIKSQALADFIVDWTSPANKPRA
jgi:hypothetical protein